MHDEPMDLPQQADMIATDWSRNASTMSVASSSQYSEQLEDLSEFYGLVDTNHLDESEPQLQSETAKGKSRCRYEDHTPGVFDDPAKGSESQSTHASTSTGITNSVPTTIQSYHASTSTGATSSNSRKRNADAASLEGPAGTSTRKLTRTESSTVSRSQSSTASASATARVVAPIPVSPEDPIVIAHSPDHQVDMGCLPWGIQWEVARYTALGLSYGDIDFDCLKGSTNKQASEELKDIVKSCRGNLQTSQTVDEGFAAAFKDETAAKSPWEDLDREDEAVRENREHVRTCADLECDKHTLYLHDDPDWYGGKVHFTGKLKCKEKNGSIIGTPYIELDKPLLSTSNRFTRRFGSCAFVRIRLDKDIVYRTGEFLMRYFRHPFVISGRVFRAFYAKDHNVFLFRTNEVVGTRHGPDANDGRPMYCVKEPRAGLSNTEDLSFLEFLNWHNAIELNNHQTMTKWAARFALGLSNSVPGVRIAPEDVVRISDMASPMYKGSLDDIPTELTMTDGCGFANANFFKLLQDRFQWSTYPTAIQMRIKGAKGLLVLHPDHPSVTQDRRPRVWIRDSQEKVIYSADVEQDVGLYTVDILRSSHMATPARLSVETIINLSENGVETRTLTQIMQLSLQERVDRLTLWNDPERGFTLANLWRALAKEGGVFAARLARQSVGSARAMGYVYEAKDSHEDEDDEDELDESEKGDKGDNESTAWWPDPISGSPSSLEETAMCLLDSGFSPDDCALLRSKLKPIASKSLKSCQNKYRFAIAMSCSAFVIPDPCGVLAPGEVHIKSSTRNLIDQDGNETDIVLGDVLLTRHPCKVPTDVQKATAVIKSELRNYLDVIVVSTKGHVVNGEILPRHLASMTGGGDYDGDLMQAFWQPEFVRHFRSADKKFAEEPETLSSCLSKVNETTTDFLNRVPDGVPYTRRIYEMQKFLLGSLRDANLVGTYSTMWENCIYLKGYDHPETVRLANLFCKILDGAKTGITVDRAQLRRDQDEYALQRGPSWKEIDPARTAEITNRPVLLRPRHLGHFIMDSMRKAVDAACDQQMAIIDARLGELYPYPLDVDLRKPWIEFERRGGNEEACEAIKEHVETVRAAWSEATARKKGRKSFTALPITVRQDVLRNLAMTFVSGPDVEITVGPDDPSFAQLKASYAYLYDHDRSGARRWSRFPWDVAFRSLCEIKAKALGPTKTVTSEFYSMFTVKSSFTKRS